MSEPEAPVPGRFPSDAQWRAWAVERAALLREHEPETPAHRVILGAIRRVEQQRLVRISTAFASILGGGGPRVPEARPHPVKGVLLKVVSDACNLRCTYCYEGVGSNRYQVGRMPAGTLRKVIAQVCLQAAGPVFFSWHGGEPLLAGRDLFALGVAFQRKFEDRVQVRNTVQTNGLLVDDSWAQFFHENRFSVGVSIDGPADLHDRVRVDAQGAGSFGRVARAVQLLHDHQVPCGAITVVGPEHRGRAADLYATMRNLGIRSFDVHPSCSLTESGLDSTIHPANFAEFMVELFECWLAGGDPGVRILAFDEMFAFLFGDGPSVCYNSGRCSEVLAVEADGNVVSCTRPFARDQYTFGNWNHQDLAEILAGEAFRRFTRQDSGAQQRSRDCPWYGLCHNGCPQHRASGDRADVGGAGLYCRCQSGIDGGNDAIWSHIFDRVNSTLAAGPSLRDHFAPGLSLAGSPGAEPAPGQEHSGYDQHAGARRGNSSRRLPG